MSLKVKLGLYMFTPMIGGAEQYFKDLIWHLDRTRYDVTVFYEPWPAFEEFLDLHRCHDVRLCPIRVVEPGGHHTDVRYPRPAQTIAVTFLRLFIKYAFALPNFLTLYRAFRKYPVDVLHINNGGFPGAQSACLAAIAAKLAGCRRCVMTIANTPIPSKGRPHERLLDYGVAKSLDRVVVLSDGLGRPLLERSGFTAAQLVAIPYGILDSHELLGTHSERGISRKNQGPKAATLVGMFANFLPHKGHRYLVEAASLVCQHFPDFRILFVGGGPGRDAIEKLVEEHKLGDQISFKGPCTHLEALKLMCEIDIFVLSSELEGMPYVILEAMSLAKPVLASNIGGISDEVVSGQTGLLVPARDVGALAQALEQLVKDPGLAQAMGEAGYARYQAHFTLRQMIDRHMALYDHLAVPNATG